MDVLLVNEELRIVSIVELKAANWGTMARHRVLPNVRRYARQVWKYIDELEFQGYEVCPDIWFLGRPSDPAVAQMVEDELGRYGIATTWNAEEISPVTPWRE